MSEEAIQAIAAKAQTFEDILDAQARLSEVRGQIEELDGQLASLEDRADLGTLTVAYGTDPVAVAAVAEPPRWDLGGEIARATESLLAVLRTLATAGIWFAIVWVPIIVLLVAVALAARLLLRRVGLPARVEAELARPTLPRTEG